MAKTGAEARTLWPSASAAMIIAAPADHTRRIFGLIVDYCGILKSLRQALATFAGSTDGDDGAETDPVRPEEELLKELGESIAIAREYLKARGADLAAVVNSLPPCRSHAVSTGFRRSRLQRPVGCVTVHL